MMKKIGARLRKQLFTTIMHQEVAFFDQVSAEFIGKHTLIMAH
jgi:hypothetical protein